MPVTRLTPGNPVNQTYANVVKTRSHYDNVGHQVAGTYRFGEISPILAFESVPKDNLRYRSDHDLQSLNLVSPQMSSLSLKKDFFQVPISCILPKNWDKLMVNPTNGDDVVAKNVNTTISIQDLYDYLSGILSAVNSEASSDMDQAFSDFIRFWLFLDMIFGEGSLSSALGLHLSNYVEVYIKGKRYNISDAFDLAISNIFNGASPLFTLQTVDPSGTAIDTIYTRSSGASLDPSVLRRIFEVLRDNPNFKFTETSSGLFQTILGEFMSSSGSLYLQFLSAFSSTVTTPLNYAPLAAYQIVCKHFYSNDRVDYIYSASLYRDLMQHYVMKSNSSINYAMYHFTYNSVEYEYDALAGYCLSSLLSKPTNFYASCYISQLFNFQRSLRYVDYFTGARTRPLAVGNTDVNVNNSSVSVVDVTQKIQVQRFLNNVNRVGRKVSNYFKGIDGVDLPYDMHDPKYLSHTNDRVSGPVTENTGSSQMVDANSRTAVFRSQSGRFEFSFDCSVNSIIIGMMYFDIVRSYANTLNRCWQHVSRFDYFNPDLQFVGDQEVLQSELHPAINGTSVPFAYQTKYMEYREHVNECFGGFVNGQLPSWLFIADQDIPQSLSLSPDYIRSSSIELDRYYRILNGLSLGTYFHFIITHDVSIAANRPVALAPQLL